jgi:transposase
MIMSRPKLDPTLSQRIVDLIRAGNYLETAATAVGIHKSTLHRWLSVGRQQKRGRFHKFLLQVEKAQAESESRDVALVAKAAGTDWRAAAWRKACRRRSTTKNWGAASKGTSPLSCTAAWRSCSPAATCPARN